MNKYFVYVIELDEEVAEYQKFRTKNPFYIKGSGCLYIGQSTRKPELRFEQHKEGYKSNSYAKKFGLRLRPDIYDKYNPIPTRIDALEIEKMLGKRLRKKGVGVWFNWWFDILMQEYDKEELKNRRPLNIIAIILALVFISFAVILYNQT